LVKRFIVERTVAVDLQLLNTSLIRATSLGSTANPRG